MAEIELKFNGDSSSAQDSVRSLAESVDKLANAVDGLKEKEKEHGEEQAKAIEKWRQLGEAAKKSIEILYEFGKDSAKEFLASEQAARRLSFAVGKELGSAFKETAESMEKAFGVQAESVMNLQQKLAQFSKELTKGDIDTITKSMLDYSAATGEDAVQATEKLLMATQKGRTAFKETGITYDLVGEKAKDLMAAAGALGDKFGGASESEANSMAGQVARAAREFENFKKGFGEIIVLIGEKTKVVHGFTAAMQSLTEVTNFFIGAKTERDKVKAMLADTEETFARYIKMRDLALASPSNRHEGASAHEWNAAAQGMRQQADELERRLRQEEERANGARAGAGGTDLTIKSEADKKAADRKAADEAMRERRQRIKEEQEEAARAARHTQDLAEDAYKSEHELAKKWSSAKVVLRKETQDRLGKQAQAEYERESVRLESFLETSLMSEEDKNAERLKLSMEYANRHLQLLEEQYRVEETMHEKAIARQKEMERAAYRQQQADFRKQAEMLHRVAAQMGQAIGSGLGQAIGAGIAGTGAASVEAEVFQAVGHAIVSAISAVVSQIPYAGWILGPIVQAMGTVSVDAIAGEMRAAAMERAKDKTAQQMADLKFHDGGWIGAPRYHSGSWIGADEQPAILQTGERVLSRSEVSRMGGAAAVDGHALGAGGGRGPAVTVHIQAIDTQGIKKFFEDSGGDGFRRAIQSGKGDIARMFGKGKIF